MDIQANEQWVWCFDLDDTLYNELDYLRSAYAEIARILEPNHFLELYTRMFSMYRNRDNVFEFLTENYTITTEKLLEQYRNHIPKITPFAGTVELLQKIKASGGKLVCITDGRSITQRNKLKALDILDLFDLLVISEEVGSTKPSELNFTLVEEHYPDKKYVYVGDNWKKDFLIPNERNWGSIGLIDNGKNIHNRAFEYLPYAKHRPKQLIRYISELNIIG